MPSDPLAILPTCLLPLKRTDRSTSSPSTSSKTKSRRSRRTSTPGRADGSSSSLSWIGAGPDVASNDESFVGGGARNTANGSTAVVEGGLRNTASGFESFVAGGNDKTAGPGTCGYFVNVLIGTC